MAEALAIGGAAEGAGSVAAVGKAAGETSIEVAQAFTKEAAMVQARQTKTFDFEKVFFNSTYAVGLFGLSYAAVKMGQLMIWVINGLDWLDFTNQIISPDAVKKMNKVGETLRVLDENFFIPIGPIVPVGIVSGMSAFEWLRVRKFQGDNTKKAGDIILGIGAVAAVYLAYVGLTAKGDETKPLPVVTEGPTGYGPDIYQSEGYVLTYVGSGKHGGMAGAMYYIYEIKKDGAVVDRFTVDNPDDATVKRVFAEHVAVLKAKEAAPTTSDTSQGASNIKPSGPR